MPYPRLLMRQAPPSPAGLMTRADVALFVGLTPRRQTPVPTALSDWLEAAGWAGSGTFARSPEKIQALLDVPTPVESWGAFEELFAWDERVVEKGSPILLPCPLGLAVRSFFAEGGVKAYVVRVGDPLPLIERTNDAATVLAHKRKLLSWTLAGAPADAAARIPLLPGFGGLGTPADAGDPRTWHGAAHVWGLDEVALMALPDLPELFAGPPAPIPGLPAPPAPPEQFKPCAPSTAAAEPELRRSRLAASAPRLDRAGYRAWSAAVRHVLDMLAAPRGAAHRRDVMLVAALPLPSFAPDATPARTEAWPLSLLDDVGVPAAGERLLDADSLGSARLQLVYPWVETAASAAMPEGVEGAEGVLMGLLAHTALTQGAFRSAAGTELPTVTRTLPELGTGDLMRGLPSGRADWLGDRLSLVGQHIGRMTLLSDATMSADLTWRAGGVSRLMGVILRAARWLGVDRLFDPAGPALWASLKRELEGFLDRLWQAGALDGATRAEAYTVRCDRTTMSQNDIDAGRTIATIAFTAAQPIQRITVTLALSEAGLAGTREAA